MQTAQHKCQGHSVEDTLYQGKSLPNLPVPIEKLLPIVNAVCRIDVYEPGRFWNTYISHGTGFLIGKGLIMTNAHVFEDPFGAPVDFEKAGPLQRIKRMSDYAQHAKAVFSLKNKTITLNFNPKGCFLVSFGSGNTNALWQDYVIVETGQHKAFSSDLVEFIPFCLERPDQEEVSLWSSLAQSLGLGSPKDQPLSEPLFQVGYPRSRGKTISCLMVQRWSEEYHVCYSSSLDEGSSGGPVLALDAKGNIRLWALAHARYRDNEGPGPGLGIPATAILESLRRLGIDQLLTQKWIPSWELSQEERFDRVGLLTHWQKQFYAFDHCLVESNRIQEAMLENRLRGLELLQRQVQEGLDATDNALRKLNPPRQWTRFEKLACASLPIFSAAMFYWLTWAEE
ncbi:MAG: serine protease [Parachlamydiales bacterium]